jgi:hypothetical protein
MLHHHPSGNQALPSLEERQEAASAVGDSDLTYLRSQACAPRRQNHPGNSSKQQIVQHLGMSRAPVDQTAGVCSTCQAAVPQQP